MSSVSGQAMEEPMGAASNADTTYDAKSVGSTSQVRHTLGECYNECLYEFHRCCKCIDWG